MARSLIALVFLSVARPAAAEEMVIKAATVYTMTGAPLSPGAVRVKDGKIAEVGAAVAVPAGVKEIDLGRGVLIPGLIDAHTSLGVEGGTAEVTLEVTPNFRVLDAVDWSARAFRHARAEGTTTVGLVPSTENVIDGVGSVVKTAGDPARRVVRADGALVVTLTSDPANGNSARNRPDSIYNRQPTNRMGVVWMLRSAFAKARSTDAPETAPLREALDGRRSVVCVSRSDSDIVGAIRFTKEFPVALTIAGGHEAYRVRSDLAAAKVPVLLAPLTTTAGSGPEGTETVLNPAGQLHEAGVTFALTGGRLLDQARLAVRFGLPKDAALAAVTSAPARILGLDGRLGGLAPGRDADLVALSGDPFDLTSTVRWTMIDGVLRAEEP
jgi:imidazolonepropionase-like amidohydrolase